MIKAVRGTRDLLPPETALWNFVEADGARRVPRLQLPRNPHADLRIDRTLRPRRRRRDRHRLQRNVHLGGRGRAESDKGQSLTLRPENTAGVVRAYIEHKLWDARTEQALLHRAAIPPRASAERTLSPVLSDRRGESSGPPPPAANRPRATPKFSNCSRRCSTASASQDWTLELNSVGCPADRATLQRSSAQGARAGQRQNVRRLPAPRRDQSAARVRLQSSRRSADHRDAAAHQPISRRTLPQALRSRCRKF